MAIWGTVASIEQQAQGAPAWAPALAYLRAAMRPGSAVRHRILALTPGETERVELGNGIFALEQAYEAKARSVGRLEAHGSHLDLQLIVHGEENMEVTTADGLTVSEDALAERDVRFFADGPPVSVWRVRAGEVAVFYPADAHKPSLETAPGVGGVVFKTVVKVPFSA